MVIIIYEAFSAVLAALTKLSIIVLLVVILNLIRRLFSDAGLPHHLPWAGAGENPGPFSRAKANFSSIFHIRLLLEEGYNKYSKNGQVYVLPYFIDGPQVILPMSQIGWLLSQPEHILSQEDVNAQFLQAKYTLLGANRAGSPVHTEVIRHQLTQKIHSYADDIADEMQACLEELWGTDTDEWREIRVYDTVLEIITRLSTRVFVGLPLCRNKVFLKACSSYIRNVVLVAAAISLFPDFLKPIFGPVLTLYDRMQHHRTAAFLKPMIRERLAQLEKQSPVKSEPPNDYIQWSLTHALSHPSPDPIALDPSLIASRFSVLAFAAVQSSAITLTNALFDLAACEPSPPSRSAQAVLRQEVVREVISLPSPSPSPYPTSTCSSSTGADSSQPGAGAEAGVVGGRKGNGDFGKPALARLRGVDSALRETLRLHAFVERGVVKMVRPAEGVELPPANCNGNGNGNGNGDGNTNTRLPRGTKVGVSGYCVHRDAEVYADPERYDAFRFVGAGGEGKGKGNERLVHTSETFMSFSHGAHACPGRFFAANQLKIALAHIVWLYEIEPIARRPENKWFFGHIAPPMRDTLRVRRRKI
ncbi:cytochrome P450 [Camillea tinctor]|nr:cytochrome P450 [Camillea tinctor]